ncbi:hypothetical protein PUNSTDRAFT_131739 [Punctularia strigosozonata HHB-11173 SS5]|uniref:uncharacterized protein n=1 Tax=Punctularia strigosozonata (strain HHB-11173) TaxID=741275 RepID=UPI00044166C9|nr:uncharacterized protein PUNSTDRAFT_131739 [Punctularia strigosozonata HHB-11173 SS5]EIN11577.1 hypothetical protein PUNSTDRAFT_131739 [Punctularia strigosozonata HHB-11173 SS5]
MSNPTLHPIFNLSQHNSELVARNLSAAGGEAAMSAMRATLMAIYGSKKTLKPPSFSDEHLALVAADVSPSTASLQATGDFGRAVAEAAFATACGSMLAGQSSESDEYGDVAVFLGDGEYGPGHEGKVLEALGLVHWKEGIEPIPLDPSTGLPKTTSGTGEAFSHLTSLLQQLKDRYAFLAKSSETPEKVLYVLVGRLSDGWVGLVGVGIWSDL